MKPTTTSKQQTNALSIDALFLLGLFWILCLRHHNHPCTTLLWLVEFPKGYG